MKRAAWLSALPLLLAAEALRVDVALFSQGNMADWQSRQFSGTTRYTLGEDDGRRALRADSRAAASGLFRKVQVDPAATPYLYWSWKVDGVLRGNDERSRDGDDYAARVYVVFSGGLWFWRTRAVNYVWSSHQHIERTWLNAYTGNARMIAVESGATHAGEWIHERRDVRADYLRLFGEEPGRIVAVALMTDTDNTGATAGAWYGDIWFAAE
jgi:hypothetical protein